MATFRFTRLAETDLLNIGEYTLRNRGEAQTAKYLAELESACERLASGQLPGRACNHIRRGIYCSLIGRHVLFYRRAADHILILRVLHQRMLPERHLFSEDESGLS